MPRGWEKSNEASARLQRHGERSAFGSPWAVRAGDDQILHPNRGGDQE